MTRVALTHLNEHECWALLAAHRPRLGRIAFTDRGATVVYPMNFAVARRAVYLRTDPASRLSVAVDSQEVGFEVDHVDPSWERGWSVLVQGRLSAVTDPDELERHRELVLRTWAPGDRLRLLRLDPTTVSGRRIR